MAVREIDETELLAYQQITAAVKAMQSHPKARKLLADANGMINPKAPPAQADPLEEEITSTKSEIAELRKELAADRAAKAEEAELSKFQSKWNSQKAALRARGFTDDGISKVEEYAHANGVPDLRIAAAAWEQDNPPPAVAEPKGTGAWNFYEAPAEDDTFVKRMIDSQGNDESALDAEIRKTLTDMRGQGRR